MSAASYSVTVNGILCTKEGARFFGSFLRPPFMIQIRTSLVIFYVAYSKCLHPGGNKIICCIGMCGSDRFLMIYNAQLHACLRCTEAREGRRRFLVNMCGSRHHHQNTAVVMTAA